jgi:hypothetical protein
MVRSLAMNMILVVEILAGIDSHVVLFLAHAGEVHDSGRPGGGTVLNAVGIVVLVLLGFRLVSHLRGHSEVHPGDGDSDPSSNP